MKTLVSAIFLASVLATSVVNIANAATCNTRCYWLGDTQYCNTSCY